MQTPAIVSEVVSAILALLCAYVPTLETQLKDAGESNIKKDATVVGAVETFLFDEKLPQARLEELGWAAYSLQLYTNSYTILLVIDGEVKVTRGYINSKLAGIENAQRMVVLGRVNEEFAKATKACKFLQDAQNKLDEGYSILSTRAEVSQSQILNYDFAPPDTESVLVVPFKFQPLKVMPKPQKRSKGLGG